MSRVVQRVGTCWDFWNCPKDRRVGCEIYQKKVGNKCFVESNFIPICQHKYSDCTECAWYRYNREE